MRRSAISRGQRSSLSAGGEDEENGDEDESVNIVHGISRGRSAGQ